MIVTTLALVVVTALSLVFAETRLLGVFGIALLTYLHPLSLLAVVVVAAVAVVLFNLKERRSHRALPSPDTRRD